MWLPVYKLGCHWICIWLTRWAKAAIRLVFLTQWAGVCVCARVQTGGTALRVFHVIGAFHSLVSKKIQHQANVAWIRTVLGLTGQWSFTGLSAFSQVSMLQQVSSNITMLVIKEDLIVVVLKSLPQKAGVLQLGGFPPAWEHWREYSDTVLQRDVFSMSPGRSPHLSVMQAWI